jgi:hypothetical protein
MSRILLAAGLAGLLCACTSIPDWGWLPGRSGPALAAGEKQYDFRWRLSGDRAVAPLQVFDDGRQTWLQFAPGQTVPAIFRGGARGDQPLDYRRAGPYVVLDGVWPRLVLRGGGLRGAIERATGGAPAPQSAQASPVSPVSPAVAGPAAGPTPSAAGSIHSGAGSIPSATGATASVAGSTSMGIAQAGTPLAARKPAAAKAGPLAAAPARSAIVSTRAAAATAVPAPLAQARPGPLSGPVPVKLAGPIAPSYEVGPRDGNLRQALSRWARSAGWTFEPEHWAVDADIPITGSARFDSGFKRSVQDLVASTELSEKPLQPCFYSNKVLRIVPYAQACDRSADPARVS